MMQTNVVSRERRQKMMLEEPMLCVIPKVAIPMIISTVIDSLYNLADTFFVSGLGQTATAAVAVNDSLMNILRAVAMGFAMGAASYIVSYTPVADNSPLFWCGRSCLLPGYIRRFIRSGFGNSIGCLYDGENTPLIRRRSDSFRRQKNFASS